MSTSSSENSNLNIFKRISFFNDINKFWFFLISLYFFTRLTTWFYPIDGDHWIFWTVGKNIAEGGSLYITSWDHKAPLVFFFNAFLYIVGGDNIWIHRFIITLVSILGVYLFYKLAIILTNSEQNKAIDLKVKVALIFYVFWINLSHISSGGNNNENLGIIFLIGSYLSYLTFFKNKNFRFLILAGFLVSCLFFLKVNFSLFALPILIHILFTEWKNLKKIITYFVIFGIPVLAHIIFWVIYFYSRNSLDDFLIAAFFFNSKYISSGWIGKVSGQLGFIAINIPLITTFLISLYLATKQFKAQRNEPLYIFLLSCGFTSLLFISLLGTFYPYYYLIIIPCVSLLCGIFLGSIDYNQIVNKLLLIIIIGCSLIAGGISLKQPYNFFAGEAKVDFEEQTEVANYIKDNSSREDKVIAYVYGSTFYYLTSREQGIRYTSASNILLNYRENYGFNLNEKFIEDAEKNRPKYVIMIKDENNLYSVNKPLIQYFNEKYVLDKSFDNYVVMKRVN